jgi:hypothetical protein
VKSADDQIKAIEALYKTGSISKEEYNEMIRMVKPEDIPRVYTEDTKAKFPYKKLGVLAGIFLVVFLVFFLLKGSNNNSEEEIAKENQIAQSLAKLECDCDVIRNQRLLISLKDLNGRIAKNQIALKSDAISEYKALIRERDLNTGLIPKTCSNIADNKSQLFSKYAIGTPSHERLDSIYNDYLIKERQNLDGDYFEIDESIKIEMLRYEDLIKNNWDINKNNSSIGNDDNRFSQIISAYNVKKIRFNNEVYLFFPQPISLNDIKALIAANVNDPEGYAYRLPTFTEMKWLFRKNSEAGTGYYTNGKYYKAKMPYEFNCIGSAAWFWIDEVYKSCINMYNGAKIDSDKSSMNFPVHALLIGEIIGC